MGTRQQNAERDHDEREVMIIDQPSQDEIDIAGIIAELGQSDKATVQIYREGVNRRDITYLTEMLASEFSVAMLQHAPFYGGKFLVQVKDGITKKIRAAPSIKVEPLETNPHVRAAGQGISQAQNVSDGASIAALANAMQAGFAQMAASIRDVIANRPKEKTQREMIEEMMLIKQLVMPPDRPALPAPQQSPMDMLSTVKQMAEVMNILRPEGGGGERGTMDVIYKAAETLLPMLSRGMEAQMHAAAQQSQQAPSGPPVPPYLSNPSQSQPEILEHEQVNAVEQIAKNVVMLCSAAKAGGSPQTYAEMVLDFGEIDQVVSFLERPTWFAELKNLTPGVVEYESWFTELRKEIFALLTDPDETGTPSANPENASPPDDASSSDNPGANPA